MVNLQILLIKLTNTQFLVSMKPDQMWGTALGNFALGNFAVRKFRRKENWPYENFAVRKFRRKKIFLRKFRRMEFF